VLSPQQKLLYATQGGELADARKMSETGVHDFFAQVLANAKSGKAP
jgi:thioredoxin 1